jgi:ABC-type transport system involved in cytochrome c biogenesis permease subunit
MSALQRVFPWVVGALALVYVVLIAAKPEHTGEHWREYARIPVCADGRVKPLDTFARNSMMQLSARQAVRTDGRTESATEWIVELMSAPSKAGARNVFRIDHPDVVAMLGVADAKRTRFSFSEVEPKINEVFRQAELAEQTSAKTRDPFQREVIQLANRLSLYIRIARMETPLMIAPVNPGEEWRPLADVVQNPALANQESAAAVISILQARATSDAARADTEAEAYNTLLRAKIPHILDTAEHETLFNRVEPFYQSSVLYVLAFVLACFALLARQGSAGGWFTAFNRATLAAIAVAFLVHSVGIAARIYLQGRPPVTNLYSSAVFIGWACVPLALVGEWFYRFGFGTLAASLIGFATLVVAHNLSSGGDTMEMMQAVLDSNFWLATHVVVITIGYSATVLAGFLAIAYILGGVLTPLLRGEPVKTLPRMIYGVICFASITSFVGTVLGGIWADQSWGRFWGWDPKENGAALIVAWNILILHARWGGMVKDRGVAAMAVFGNAVTAWSWFGTNMLGVGLHSYGFMDSAVFWLVSFCVAQLAVMAVALVPIPRWRSLQPAITPPETAPRVVVRPA